MNPKFKVLANYALFFIFTFFAFQLSAQNICDNGDCPAEINNINLNFPLAINTSESISDNRTQQFQIAFLQIKNIKEKAIQNDVWATKYRTWYLGGEDCVKLYYFEGLLAYEYEQNPAFKAFVDQSESDIMTFKNHGFSASRKAINLLRQMDNKCSGQARKFKKKEEKLKDLPLIYQKMGIVLGYFDEKGNVLKPLS